MSTKVVAAIALLCAIIVCGAAWQQRRDAQELKAQIASLNTQLKAKSGVIKDQEMLLQQLREENGAYRRESAALHEKLSARASSPQLAQEDAAPSPSPSAPGRGKGEFVSKIFDDPKMKKVFRQQRMLQLKQIYSDFVKERHLNPQRSGQFFDLLADGELRDMEDGVRLFNGGDESDASGIANQSSMPQQSEIDRQLKMLLGDADYAAYKAYQGTTGERMALAQIREQIGLAGTPLHDDQSKTLLQIMTDERSRTPPTAFDPRGSGSVRDRLTPLLETDNGERYLAAQADLNQRILNRTAGILSQEQYEALERFQEQQLEMEKIGVEMTRQLMGQHEDGESGSFTVTPAY